MVHTAGRRAVRNGTGRPGRRFGRVGMVAALAGLPAVGWAGGAQAQDGAEPARDALPMVVLTKTYQPDAPAAGEAITFTVTLANDSAADATGYLIDGEIPAEVTDPSWTCTATGAGSACGAEAGTGHLVDVLDVGAAGGRVVYVVTGTIDPEVGGEFTQAVTLIPGPGQACSPEAPFIVPEQGGDDGYGGGYPSPPAGGAMLCRVNNTVSPELAAPPPATAQPRPTPPGTGTPVSRPQPIPPAGGTGQDTLPRTGTPSVAYLIGGTAATLLGGALVWLSRRRIAR